MPTRSPSEGLPELPRIDLVTLREDVVKHDGFLRVRRLELIVERAGRRSAPFMYEIIDREALDACVIVAHHDIGSVAHVWLLSCVRPPVARRPLHLSQVSGVLWELPAGLVEPSEAAVDAAARELEEELGFHVDASELSPLGSFTVPAPGFVGELHHFFHVRVDPLARRTPKGDGSPLERDSTIASVPLETALDAVRRGQIRDAKTELALRRYADVLSGKL